MFVGEKLEVRVSVPDDDPNPEGTGLAILHEALAADDRIRLVDVERRVTLLER